jgi:hypothetical protein
MVEGARHGAEVVEIREAGKQLAKSVNSLEGS